MPCIKAIPKPFFPPTITAQHSGSAFSPLLPPSLKAAAKFPPNETQPERGLRCFQLPESIMGYGAQA